MGYAESIEANGLKVVEFKEFGSYQGTWIAKLDDGRVIEGSYGSCSGCDAFQAEFDSYGDTEDHIHDGKAESYYSPEYQGAVAGCAKCDDFQRRLKTFGSSYAAGAIPLAQLIEIYEKKVTSDYSWDDDKEILAWLKSGKSVAA